MESSKTKEPWEIITKPQVLSSPIGPDSKKVLFIHAFFGFFGSLIISLIIEMRKGLVVSSSECEKTLNIPELLELSTIKDEKYWEESLSLLFNSYLGLKDKKLAIYYLGNKNQPIWEKFTLMLENIFKDKYFFTNDILDFKKYEQQIIVILLGSITKSELKDLSLKLSYKEKKYQALLL